MTSRAPQKLLNFDLFLPQLQHLLMVARMRAKTSWLAGIYSSVTLPLIWTQRTLQCVNKYFHAQFSLNANDLWMHRVSSLMLLYPTLARLDEGTNESAYEWHSQLLLALCDNEALATKSKGGMLQGKTR